MRLPFKLLPVWIRTLMSYCRTHRPRTAVVYHCCMMHDAPGLLHAHDLHPIIKLGH